MRKLYLQLIGLLLSLVVVFGFIAPWLVSAESDIAVILGVAVLIAYGYGLIVYFPKIVKTIKSYVNEKL